MRKFLFKPSFPLEAIKQIFISKMLDVLMIDYFPIENHLPILNNRSGALITNNGKIDFACFPNFDSPPVFFSILDKSKGGFFDIILNGNEFYSDISYEEDTLIVKIDYYNKKEMLARLIWFMPMHHEPSIYFPEIYARLEAFYPTDVELNFAPFKTNKRKFNIYENKGVKASEGERSLTLISNDNFEIEDNIAKSQFTLKQGNIKWLVLSYGLDFPLSINAFHPNFRLNETRKFWKSWVLKSNYEGIESKSLNRSFLIIKGLFFEPSGFMVAALTTSLPESIGGGRNWDYRYMWIRDTSFVIEALIRAGYFDEALRFYLNIVDAIEKEGKIYSVYTLNGKKASDEVIDEELEGYYGSKPVRFGNNAGRQLQIDQYVSLIHGLRIIFDQGGMPSTHIISKVIKIGLNLEKIWHYPDSSIWEIRGRRRHYTYSKIMAWLGFSDLEYLARKTFSNSLAERFKRSKDEVYEFIIQNCVYRDSYFSHYPGTDKLDASLLIIPLIDFMKPEDPIFLNTLDLIVKRLMREKYLFKRYEIDDGLNGEDNAFLMLSFWYLRDLIRLKRLDEVTEGINFFTRLFNREHVLPEEIEFGSHRYLGNYPQAISHYSWALLLMDYSKFIEG